jgi:branched-chain amino acid transport system ATP-binding protein
VTADRLAEDIAETGRGHDRPATAAQPAGPLLRIRGVTVRFGAITALNDVSFEVRRGEILGLIGPNGAGKTTLFNCLSRLCDVERGSIELDGASLLDVPRHDIAGVGIGRTFQHLALFETMSVTDNVMVGTHVRERGGFWADALRLRPLVAGEHRARDHARKLLERLELTHVAKVPVGGLPFAVKKRVELARALAAEPKLLLLDEPAGGLNHEEVGKLGDQIRDIRDRFGVTILMVEHHLNFVMRVSDRVVALDFGRTLAEGTPAEMQAHPEVIRAYLGAPT